MNRQGRRLTCGELVTEIVSGVGCSFTSLGPEYIWQTWPTVDGSTIKLFGPSTHPSHLVCQHKTRRQNGMMDERWQSLLWKPDTSIFHPLYERLCCAQDRNTLGKHCQYSWILFFDVDLNMICCCSLHCHSRLESSLCHLNVWKVMLTHLWAGQLYLDGANIVSWAKYWSSVQNIDSTQLAEWGDEGSSEGTMTQLEGNPKNPDPPQFIILPEPSSLDGC